MHDIVLIRVVRINMKSLRKVIYQLLLILCLLFPSFVMARVVFDSWHTYADNLDIGSKIEVSKAANPMSGIYFKLYKAAVPKIEGTPYPYSGVAYTVQDKQVVIDGDMQIKLVYQSKGELWIVLDQEGVDASNAYYVNLPPAKGYVEVNIPLSAFKPPAWASAKVDIYKHMLSAIKFQVPGNDASSIELWVKSLELVAKKDATKLPSSSNNKWMIIPTEGDTAYIPRHENGFIGVGDQFYLIGGRGEGVDKPNETLMFDIASKKWKRRSAPPIDMHHIQPAYYNDMIYVITGYSGPCCYENTLEYIYIYDPKNDRWTQGPRIPEEYQKGAAGVALINGKFYVVGGVKGGHHNAKTITQRRIDRYDPATNSWKSLRGMPRIRDHFHAVSVEGKIYLIGGRDTSAPDNSRTVKEIDVYDTVTDQWTTMPQYTDIPTPRSGASYVKHKQHIYVIGGESLDTVHTVTEMFDTEELTWKTGSKLSMPRHGTQAGMHGNRIYLPAGAIDILVNETDSIESISIE